MTALPLELRPCATLPGASDEVIRAAEAAMGRELPAADREFLRESDGLEGFVADDAYLCLWAAGDLASLNESYRVTEFLDGVVLLGKAARRTRCPAVRVANLSASTQPTAR